MIKKKQIHCFLIRNQEVLCDSCYPECYISLCPCRSYGCVFKANYKATGEIVAIKQVPLESDLQEIIKEISIMQQCKRYVWSMKTS